MLLIDCDCIPSSESGGTKLKGGGGGGLNSLSSFSSLYHFLFLYPRTLTVNPLSFSEHTLNIIHA